MNRRTRRDETAGGRTRQGGRGSLRHSEYLLTAYLFGDISRAGRAEVERELASSDELQAEYEALAATRDLVRDALLAPEECEDDGSADDGTGESAGKGDPPSFAAERFQVLATQRRAKRRRARQVTLASVASVAATIVVAGLLFPTLQSGRDESYRYLQTEPAASTPATVASADVDEYLVAPARAGGKPGKSKRARGEGAVGVNRATGFQAVAGSDNRGLGEVEDVEFYDVETPAISNVSRAAPKLQEFDEKGIELAAGTELSGAVGLRESKKNSAPADGDRNSRITADDGKRSSARAPLSREPRPDAKDDWFEREADDADDDFAAGAASDLSYYRRDSAPESSVAPPPPTGIHVPVQKRKREQHAPLKDELAGADQQGRAAGGQRGQSTLELESRTRTTEKAPELEGRESARQYMVVRPPPDEVSAEVPLGTDFDSLSNNRVERDPNEASSRWGTRGAGAGRRLGGGEGGGGGVRNFSTPRQVERSLGGEALVADLGVTKQGAAEVTDESGVDGGAAGARVDRIRGRGVAERELERFGVEKQLEEQLRQVPNARDIAQLKELRAKKPALRSETEEDVTRFDDRLAATNEEKAEAEPSKANDGLYDSSPSSGEARAKNDALAISAQSRAGGREAPDASTLVVRAAELADLPELGRQFTGVHGSWAYRPIDDGRHLWPRYEGKRSAESERLLRGFRYYRSLDQQLTFGNYATQLEGGRALVVPAPSIGDEGLGRDGFRVRYGVNPFVETTRDRQSTFSMDVDTASFTRARERLRAGTLPDPSTVRVEEFVNYFPSACGGDSERPFAICVSGGPAPFGEGLDLLRVTIKARELRPDERPRVVLTLAVDTSGSMHSERSFDLARTALASLVEALEPDDQIGIVAYNTSAYVVLPHTPVREAKRIAGALDALVPRGGTNLENGLSLAYRLADEVRRPRAINRVILCSDGVSNVGAREPEEVLAKVKVYAKRGIYLSVVGFGGKKYNDRFLERISGEGNGNYSYVSTPDEAEQVFVRDLPATLHVLAEDAKIQVEFDEDVVRRYRLLGYENRDIADRDFRNDRVDAAEVGPGTTVTALYEIERRPGGHGALGRVFIRYRDAATRQIDEQSTPLPPGVLAAAAGDIDPSLLFIACAAETAELLRQSYWAQNGSFADVLQVLGGLDESFRTRREWHELIELLVLAHNLTVRGILSEVGR